MSNNFSFIILFSPNGHSLTESGTDSYRRFNE